MLTATFDPTRTGTGRIFPPEVELMGWIGYHGTSSYYSNDIDANGLQQKKPLAIADLERLVEIALQHQEDASGASDFVRLQSLSLTPVSELALYYVRPETFGGQGLLHVTRLIDALFGKHALNPAETAHLTALRGQIALIRSALPVIYAVNLEGLTPIALGKHTLAVHAYTAIPGDRLVGKMLIDKSVDYAAINVKVLKQGIRTALQSPAPHYIKQLPLT